MLDAVLGGCGIAFLPTWLTAEALASGRLERILSPDLVETAPIHAIWPTTRTLAPKIRFTVDELVKHFSPPKWECADPGGSRPSASERTARQAQP
jgi:DNA-binding transcriptional LysR family regulator